MFPDKLTLIEQINSVIKKNSCNQSLNNNGCTLSGEKTRNGIEQDARFHYYFPDKNEILKKIEQRVKMLEEQDDHLLYFIHFIFENFAELVKNIVLSDPDTKNGHNRNAIQIRKKKPDHTTNTEKESSFITRREMDVLNLLVKGFCAKEIASTLFISETTVITHKKHLKEKFNARNSAELISKAVCYFPIDDPANKNSSHFSI
jgi:DNA-binding CsgD family transcriptional regulator